MDYLLVYFLSNNSTLLLHLSPPFFFLNVSLHTLIDRSVCRQRPAANDILCGYWFSYLCNSECRWLFSVLLAVANIGISAFGDRCGVSVPHCHASSVSHSYASSSLHRLFIYAFKMSWSIVPLLTLKNSIPLTASSSLFVLQVQVLSTHCSQCSRQAPQVF